VKPLSPPIWFLLGELSVVAAQVVASAVTVLLCERSLRRQP
jgi:hypothetical protein